MPPRKLIAFGLFFLVVGILIWFAGSFLNDQTFTVIAILVSLSGFRALFPTPQNDETFSKELRSEERRAVILLGFLGAFIAFDFWLRNNDPKASPTFNFICNSPCPHVTFPWLPFLDRLIYLWFLWAGCMTVYFSEDILHGWKLKREFTQVFRNLGHGFLVLWPLIFAWTLLFSEGDFLIEQSLPPSVIAIYWLIAAMVLLELIYWLVGTVTGLRGNLRLVVKLDIEAFQGLVENFRDGLVGLISLVERFSRRFLNRKISPRLKGLWFRGKHLLLLPPAIPKGKEKISWKFWKAKTAPQLPQHPI